MLKIPDGSQKKTQICTRVFTRDLREIKKRAKEQGLPWQVYFRAFVHTSLRKEGKIA